MNRSIPILLRKLFLLAIICFTGSVVMAQKLYARINQRNLLTQSVEVTSKPGQRAGRSLKTVLLELEKRYRVSFNFNDDAVRKIKVPSDFEWNSSEKLEKILDRLVSQSNELTYKSIDGQNYLILEKKAPRTSIQPEKEVHGIDELPTRADNSITAIGMTSPILNVGKITAEFRVKGKVTLPNGESLPGVNIVIKGTTTGTTTDVDGNYAIMANSGSDVLVFSYIGFVSKEVPINNQSTINVSLSSDEKILSEVVVVGYGTQKRKDLTSSIGTIESSVIANQSIGNAMAAIQGRLAGVQITNNGTPGSSPSIRIRGTGSIYNAAPLYVVDGVIVNDITYLGPNDIDNITVLRDASASAIYGIQAANGVIIVTTKKGANDGKVRVSFNSYVGSKKASKILDMASTPEWITMYNERMVYSGTPDKQLDPTQFTTNTNWFNEVLTSSTTTSNDLNIQGGTKLSSFNIGVNYLKDNGLIQNDNYKRLSLRVKYDYTINKNISGGLSLVGMSANTNPASGGLLLQAFRAIPLFAPRNDQGNFTDPSNINGFYPDVQNNPAATLFYTNNWNNTLNTFANAYLNINFLKGFEFRTTLGFNPTFTKAINYNPKYKVSNNQLNTFNNLSKTTSTNINLTWDNTLSYTRSFEDKHNFKFMVGYTYRENTYDYLNGVANDIVDLPEINPSFLFLTIGKASTTSTLVASDGGSRYTQLGYMGRINYDYNGKYLVNVTMRSDASSKFPASNRRGYFPSVGVGWVLSEEKFLKNIAQINFLKLRAGWGLLGNSNIPSNLYQLTTSNGTPVIFGPDQNSGTGAVSPSINIKTSFNPNLKWEVVDETNIGFDLTAFSNAFTASFDWYYKLTRDAIFATTALGSTGLNSGGVWGNYANILNKGVELTLGYHKQIGDWGYRIDVNGSYNHNTVKSINGGGATYYDRGDDANNIQPLTRTMVGGSVGEFFGYKAIGVFQNQAQIDATPHLQNTLPGHLIFEDVNKDGVIDAKDRTAIGNPNPPFTYGLNLGINYKNFDFLFFCQGVKGNKIFNENRLLMYTTKNYDQAFYDNRWHGEGTSTTNPSVLVNPGDARTVSSFYVESGSYFRIKNIQLGYTVPKSILDKIKLERLRIYANAENPITIFNYNGFSPEVSSSDPLLSGVNNGVYPLSSVYSMGINLSF